MTTTYTLRYREVGSGDEGWTTVSGLTDTSYALTGLTAGVRYDVEVTAISGTSQSPATAGQRSTACSAPSQPTVLPTGFVLSAGDPGTNGRIAASWTVVTGANSYRLRHRAAADGATPAGEWTEIPDVVGTSQAVVGLAGTASYDVEVAAVNIDGVASVWSTTRSGVPARIASGGTQSSFSADGTTYVVHEFTQTGIGTLAMNRSFEVDYLVVAGGGGGGNAREGEAGGGGGAGGMRSGSVTLPAGATTVGVGAGGAGGSADPGDRPGEDGTASGLGAIVAAGGGGGGANRADPGPVAGRPGGSGGGAGGRFASNHPNAPGAGGAGNTPATDPSQGFAGGSTLADLRGGSGGGGAGGTGGSANGNVGAAGGSGRSSAITGTPIVYATGGSGGTRRDATQAGTPGATNRGGGGGGASHDSNAASARQPGGPGGSGVVIVRYALPA